MLLTGFTAASWTSDGNLYAEFPKAEKQEHRLARMTMQPVAGSNLFSLRTRLTSKPVACSSGVTPKRIAGS